MATALPTAAKPLAPDDVSPGDYVAVLDEQHEFPAVVWYCDRPLAGEDDVVRVRLRPREAEGPLRVTDVCTPFVFVKNRVGKIRTVDLRAVRLARIDREVARRVWRSQTEASSTRRQKKGKKHRRTK